MGILEVVLLIAGIVIFIGSFLLPSGKESGINKEAAKEEIKGLMEEEMQTVRSQMQDKMDETSEDALEKAERSLERLTNEKIMAVSDYSDTAETIEPSGSPEIGFMGETAEEGQNNNEKILEMHRQGKSTVAIAKELGLGVGEVKLVIDLYKA